MKDLEGHWYTFGKGSEGAKNALDDFQRQYNNLLAGGKDEAASGLLHGTLAQAQHILALQKEAANASQHQDLGSHTRSAASVTLSADANALKADADVQTIDDGERRKIDATKEGSAARLAAIDAAIKEEEDAGYDGTNFYRDFLTTRVQLVRQMAEEQSKLQADAAKEDADNTEKMAELSLAAEKQADAASFSFRTASRADQAAEKERFVPGEWVFASPLKHGRLPYSYTGVWRGLVRAAAVAKIGHLGTHAFRHTHRLWLDAVGTPIAVQQKMMGTPTSAPP